MCGGGGGGGGGGGRGGCGCGCVVEAGRLQQGGGGLAKPPPHVVCGEASQDEGDSRHDLQVRSL